METAPTGPRSLAAPRSAAVALALLVSLSTTRATWAQPAPPPVDANPPSTAVELPPQQLPAIATPPPRRAKWWRPADLADYFLGIGVLGLGGAVTLLGKPAGEAVIGPSFDPARPNAILAPRYAAALGKPHVVKETVPSWAVIPFGATVALGLALDAGLFPLDERVERGAPKAHDTLMGAFEAFALTFTTTEALKKTFGRLRPDFQDRVRRHYCNKSDHEGVDCNGFTGSAIPRKAVFEHGRYSFPSGHTSISSMIAMYGFLAVGGQHVWGSHVRGWVSPLVGGVVQAGLLATAVGISYSRVADGWHNPSDLLAGAAIGTFWANVAYWRRFDTKGRLRRRVTTVDVGPGPGLGGVALAGQF